MTIRGLWPKLYQNQSWDTHVDFTNSSHKVVDSYNGNADSIEEDPSETNSDEHAPKPPTHQNHSHSIFRYVLPCDWC